MARKTQRQEDRETDRKLDCDGIGSAIRTWTKLEAAARFGFMPAHWSNEAGDIVENALETELWTTYRVICRECGHTLSLRNGAFIRRHASKCLGLSSDERIARQLSSTPTPLVITFDAYITELRLFNAERELAEHLRWIKRNPAAAESYPELPGYLGRKVDEAREAVAQAIKRNEEVVDLD
jgi:hypothetical protein